MKTVTKELAVKLKEAGFPQEADYYYWFLEDEYQKLMPLSWALDGRRQNDERYSFYAAPTAEEILDSLPHFAGNLRKRGYPYELNFNKHNGKWNLYYVTVKDDFLTTEVSETLAEAAGKMFLYLAKNNLLVSKE